MGGARYHSTSLAVRDGEEHLASTLAQPTVAMVANCARRLFILAWLLHSSCSCTACSFFRRCHENRRIMTDLTVQPKRSGAPCKSRKATTAFASRNVFPWVGEHD